MGQVLEFECPAGVDYAGDAFDLVSRLTEAAVMLAKTMDMAISENLEEVHQQTRQALDKTRTPMKALEEAIAVLEAFADQIISQLDEGDEALIRTQCCSVPLTVTTRFIRRRRTVLVADFTISSSALAANQDNRRQEMVCWREGDQITCSLQCAEAY